MIFLGTITFQEYTDSAPFFHDLSGDLRDETSEKGRFGLSFTPVTEGNPLYSEGNYGEVHVNPTNGLGHIDLEEHEVAFRRVWQEARDSFEESNQ